MSSSLLTWSVERKPESFSVVHTYHPSSLIEHSMRGKAFSHSKAAMRANLFHRLWTCLPGQLTRSTLVLFRSFWLYMLYSCTSYAFCFKHFKSQKKHLVPFTSKSRRLRETTTIEICWITFPAPTLWLTNQSETISQRHCFNNRSFWILFFFLHLVE